MTNDEKITRLEIIIEQMQKVHNDLCKENKNRSKSKEISKSLGIVIDLLELQKMLKGDCSE